MPRIDDVEKQTVDRGRWAPCVSLEREGWERRIAVGDATPIFLFVFSLGGQDIIGGRKACESHTGKDGVGAEAVDAPDDPSRWIFERAICILRSGRHRSPSRRASCHVCWVRVGTQVAP